VSPARWDDEPLGRVCGQLILGGFPGPELPADFAEALGAGRRAGAILFRRNLPDLETTAELCDQIARAASPAVPFVSVDQEGGRVRRLGPPVLDLPPMRALGALGDEPLVRRAARHLGSELRALGFNVDFAPVLDVDTRVDNPIIGDRSFSADPEVVARFGGAYASGLTDSGVLACGKHFPGHGDTALDSHLALPCVGHDESRLRAVELLPFARLGPTIPSLMTAHVLYPALDPQWPATLSHRISSQLLRRELGFRGLLFSDDLEMRALSGSIEERAVLALRAGSDVLIVSSDWELQERAHAALVRQADLDASFRTRCVEAATRSALVRDRLPSTPPSLQWFRTLADSAESAEISARLRAA
jgi:beta-N-acetylhexosaminidase